VKEGAGKPMESLDISLKVQRRKGKAAGESLVSRGRQRIITGGWG